MISLRLPAGKWLTVLLWLCVHLSARAELVWQTRTAPARLEPGRKVAVASFPFRIEGGKTIRITSIVPGCDCLAAKTTKPLWGPGEAGELVVEMGVGDQVGIVQRTLSVTTDDDPKNATVLTVSAEVPELVSIRPRFLTWKKDEPREAKTATIVVKPNAAVRIDRALCADRAFAVRVEPTESDGVHRLVITPTKAVDVAQAMIRVEATIDGTPQVFLIYAALK